jgi:hypothetical protein
LGSNPIKITGGWAGAGVEEPAMNLSKAFTTQREKRIIAAYDKLLLSLQQTFDDFRSKHKL